MHISGSIFKFMHPFCKINKNKQTNASTIENRRKQSALQVSQEKKKEF